MPAIAKYFWAAILIALPALGYAQPGEPPAWNDREASWPLEPDESALPQAQAPPEPVESLPEQRASFTAEEHGTGPIQAKTTQPRMASAEAAGSVPLRPPPEAAPLPLSRPQAAGDGARPGGLASSLTVVGSLALVLAIFFAVAWLMRKGAPQRAGLLPPGIVETLGRAPLAGRQQMHLVRCGNKLLLVSISAAGADTLTEITDPLEVDRIAGVCRQSQPQSSTLVFRQILGQIAGENPGRGLFGGLSRNREHDRQEVDHA